MKRIQKLAVAAGVCACLGWPAQATDAGDEHALRTFAAERLRDAVLIYDQHFRTEGAGQYRDAIRLNGRRERFSSIAATGMGLISLAIGDQIGAIDDAEGRAEVTIAHLLGEGDVETFQTDRSESGWFRHWIDPETGAPPRNNTEKFSTIDTAILAAGAAIAGRYFAARAAEEGRPAPAVTELADRLVRSIDWSSAVRNAERGSINLVLYGPEERLSTRGGTTIPFDEYALVPCIGASAERLQGRAGAATQVWRELFDAAHELPMSPHDDLTLLGKPSGSVPSHFTHQFAFHLCSGYASDPVFLDEMRELMDADRRWFEARGGPDGLWGLGAGSEVLLEDLMRAASIDGEADARPAERYGVARLGRNPNMTASPAIMAGFLAVDEAQGDLTILRELDALWRADMCRYDLEGLGFLWRCSAYAPDVRVSRVEAIDFSTWMLGLAVAHPEIGLRFFQRYAL